jgi:hypothetical protein
MAFSASWLEFSLQIYIELTANVFRFRSQPLASALSKRWFSLTLFDNISVVFKLKQTQNHASYPLISQILYLIVPDKITDILENSYHYYTGGNRILTINSHAVVISGVVKYNGLCWH